MGPSSDHAVRLLELSIGHWAFFFIFYFFLHLCHPSLLSVIIIRHDEYQACGKEADEIVLRVF